MADGSWERIMNHNDGKNRSLMRLDCQDDFQVCERISLVAN